MKIFDSSKPFYKGNLHTHTTVSDGVCTPEETARLYQQNGYDFLAITDHWRVGGEFRCGNMLVLPGVEYDFTFETQVLHMVALLRKKEDAEGIVRGMPHDEVIKRVNACGGVPIAAHPAWSLNTTEFLLGLDDVELAEVYNTLSGEPLNAPRADSSGVLDVAAANGKKFGWIAADDTHFHRGEQCRSYIMLQADELTVSGVLEALRAGKFYATQGPEFFSVERINNKLIVKTSPVSLCTFSSNNYWVAGRCRTGENMTENIYEIQPGERFVRCEIADEQGNRAWLSPIVLG